MKIMLIQFLKERFFRNLWTDYRIFVLQEKLKRMQVEAKQSNTYYQNDPEYVSLDRKLNHYKLLKALGGMSWNQFSMKMRAKADEIRKRDEEVKANWDKTQLAYEQRIKDEKAPRPLFGGLALGESAQSPDVLDNFAEQAASKVFVPTVKQNTKLKDAIADAKAIRDTALASALNDVFDEIEADENEPKFTEEQLLAMMSDKKNRNIKLVNQNTK